VVFYSPREKFGEEERCRKFTAIGEVQDDLVYQVHLQDGFSPFRRRVTFHDCVDAPIEPLVPSLSFIKNKKSWGYLFRFGMFQIPREDFEKIASVMIRGGKDMESARTSHEGRVEK